MQEVYILEIQGIISSSMGVDMLSPGKSEAQAYAQFEAAKQRMYAVDAVGMLSRIGETLAMSVQVTDDFEQAKDSGGYPYVEIGPEFMEAETSSRNVLRVYPEPSNLEKVQVVMFHEILENTRRVGRNLRGHTVRRDLVSQRALASTIFDRLKEIIEIDNELGEKVKRAIQSKNSK